MMVSNIGDSENVNPYPWWDSRHPFHMGDVPNPPIQVGDFPYNPNYAGNHSPSTAPTQNYHVTTFPETFKPSKFWEHNPIPTVWFPYGENKSKGKHMITQDAFAINIVTEGKESLVIAAKSLGVAESIEAIEHFIGLRHVMPTKVRDGLEQLTYANPKPVFWQVEHNLFMFERTILISEE